MMTDNALSVDDDRGRRSLHAIAPHRQGDWIAVAGLIDANRKSETEFIDERSFAESRSASGPQPISSMKAIAVALVNL